MKVLICYSLVLILIQCNNCFGLEQDFEDESKRPEFNKLMKTIAKHISQVGVGQFTLAILQLLFVVLIQLIIIIYAPETFFWNLFMVFLSGYIFPRLTAE